MSSKFTEAFDSLGSDDNKKRERAERILSSQSASAEQTKPTGTGSVAVAARLLMEKGLRAVAWVTAIAVFVGVVAISVPTGISLYNNRGLLGAISLLKNTFVDMDGVAAFGVWNAPDGKSKKARITNVSYVRTPANSLIDESGSDETLDGDDTDADNDNNNGDIITGDWSDDERYDWESDYDWDPTKANVLIAIGEDGKISEVVYERTNGRGQVRQDKLGNAAMVYVSNGFTYVMYVDDDEWKFWQDINFAQVMRSSSGFSCHHECMQTVVIHNATGKVFALKDIIPQVNELSGAMNYTLSAQPFKNDFLYVQPMYGKEIPQWYTVVYDEETEKIRYELMLPIDSVAEREYDRLYFARAARRDKYGQNYLLEGYNTFENPRVTAGIVELPTYTTYENTLVISEQNGILYGADNRVYAFDGGKLKVFGENFELTPVEAGTEVTFEGVANEFFDYGQGNNEGIVYRLSGGYLYSMFGEVWTVDDDGTMHEREKLKGTFPRYADDGFMLGGEIIGFVNVSEYEKYSMNGKIVHIRFENIDGMPRANITHIINASELSVQPNTRTVIWQNEGTTMDNRGFTKYFLLTVQDGTPMVDYFAYGRDGGMLGVTKPITEPLDLT